MFVKTCNFIRPGAQIPAVIPGSNSSSSGIVQRPSFPSSLYPGKISFGSGNKPMNPPLTEKTRPGYMGRRISRQISGVRKTGSLGFIDASTKHGYPCYQEKQRTDTMPAERF
ncbi:MAG: hypothetical protein DRH37_02145 [Deltaproteobacteria bacterium]|nr:MAG: hypothetical protein DRH37_02145 [Deltaproteobacteria bacterium]